MTAARLSEIEPNWSHTPE